MKKENILIIGNSPQICVSAIYLHTANISVSVIRTNTPITQKCTYIPGLPGITYEEFREKCFKQIQSMGINLIEHKDLKIKCNEDTFVVDCDNVEFHASILLLDKNVYALEKHNHLYVIDERLTYKSDESIILAGAGCKVALSIREDINTKNVMLKENV